MDDPKTPKRRMGRAPVKSAVVRDYLEEHPFATNDEVVGVLKCSETTVARIRRELRFENKNPNYHDRHNTQKITEETIEPTLDVTSVSDLLNVPTDAELIDANPAEMKRILSKILRNPGLPPQVRIAAISQKQKLDYEERDKHELGPGPPLSRADAVDRLSMLMKACGTRLVRDAITLAFGGSNATTKAMDGLTSAQAPSEDASEPTGQPASGTAS